MKNSLLCLVIFLFILMSGAEGIAQCEDPDDYRCIQEYLFDPSNTGAGPIGVGAWNGWTIPGSDGANVKMVDIETQGWYLNHEDLPSGISYIFGDFSEDDHGTAVLGIIVGRADNAIGITGIAPAVEMMVANGEFNNVREVDMAIDEARIVLSEGDILVLETQWSRQGMLLPEEDKLDSYNAINDAIADSIIVIEAAGNGNVNLDNALTRPPTDAIMVGAGKSDLLERVSTSNYGNRVHVHAWGEEVVTAGYGDLDDGGTLSDPNDDYTNVFGNTSAATAIVAGVVASIQGMYTAATGGPPLGPKKMRKILTQSGLQQLGNPQEPIGYRH